MDEIPLSSKEQCSWNAPSTQEDEGEEKQATAKEPHS